MNKTIKLLKSVLFAIVIATGLTMLVAKAGFEIGFGDIWYDAVSIIYFIIFIGTTFLIYQRSKRPTKS